MKYIETSTTAKGYPHLSWIKWEPVDISKEQNNKMFTVGLTIFGGVYFALICILITASAPAGVVIFVPLVVGAFLGLVAGLMSGFFDPPEVSQKAQVNKFGTNIRVKPFRAEAFIDWDDANNRMALFSRPQSDLKYTEREDGYFPIELAAIQSFAVDTSKNYSGDPDIWSAFIITAVDPSGISFKVAISDCAQSDAAELRAHFARMFLGWRDEHMKRQKLAASTSAAGHTIFTDDDPI